MSIAKLECKFQVRFPFRGISKLDTMSLESTEVWKREYGTRKANSVRADVVPAMPLIVEGCCYTRWGPM